MLMFETAELGQRIDKRTYKDLAPVVRASLLDAQRKLAAANFSVVINIDGLEGAGKSETINTLLEWLDARGIQTHAMEAPSDEERERPALWRYWRRLPAEGHIGIFFGAWDKSLITQRAFNKCSEAEFETAIDRLIEFEQMLVQENVLLVKFWLHLSKRAQKKRLKQLETDPRQAWRVDKRVWKLHRRYSQVRSAAELLVRRTNIAGSMWHIIEGEDSRYRNLTVAQRLLDALQTRLHHEAHTPPPPAPVAVKLSPPEVNVIQSLDLTAEIADKDRYKDEMAQWQAKLGELTRRMHKEHKSMILVFEGTDAAGKGGAIRRITQAMDARDYQVMSVAAPTDEEKAHPYLWRFWRHMPRRGKATIYDRSWYGRVLVERVEGFCTEAQWQRAYGEINAFEQQLADSGVIVHKFWLAISPEEQLKRFEERQETPFKQYKITPDDWRNREKWDSYIAAACEMLEKTTTDQAPWTLVEANDKRFARVKVLKTIVKRLEKAFKTDSE